jgi:DNA-binding NarL/FixJ family response regulator
MKSNYNVYICDDHKLFLESIEVFIGLQPGYTCIGNSEFADTAIKEIEELKPDIILIDYHLPNTNGLVLLENIRKINPNVACFILTMRRDAGIRNTAKELGARGYLLKSMGAEEMMTVFEVVLSDSIHFFDALEKDTQYKNEPAGKKLLSEREIQISKMVCNNEPSYSIAKTLGLSLHTVNTHRKNILRKIEGKNPIDLMNYLKSQGEKID